MLGFGCLDQSEEGGFVSEFGIAFMVHDGVAVESFFLVLGSREEGSTGREHLSLADRL